MHARRNRPDAGHLDRRRLAGAGLSAILPGLGQLVNRRGRLALMFLVPSLGLLAVALLLVSNQSAARLAAWIASPNVLSVVLTVNLIALGVRLASVGQAFLDTRWHGRTGRLGIVGLAVIVIAVAVPHVIAYRYGTALGDTFSDVFRDDLGADGEPAPPVPLDARINVLVIGSDKLPWRSATLTDSMMVVSLDPVGQTVSMASIPRDLVNVPLGNGDDYGPKLNSLMAYADRNPDEFPNGGADALRTAVAALLAIDIPYYASIDLFGFVEMVDAVGGVDIVVDKGFDDPEYGSHGMDGQGWAITAGRHHLDGIDAMAYARARTAPGESDFTRAARQQQILVALRDTVARDGSLLWELPELLETIGQRVRTNLPISQLPALAAIVDEIDGDVIARAVIRHPLVRSERTRYGSSLVPDLPAIRAMAAALFPDAGRVPVPWPPASTSELPPAP